MAENKQYITQIQDNGTVMISEDVVATIVEHTLTEVEGVVKGGAEVVGKKSWGKCIRIAIAEDNSLTIGCNIVVAYGESVMDVAKAVQNAISNAVESVTGVTVADVNVNICGIVRKSGSGYDERQCQRTGSTFDLRTPVHRRRAGAGCFHPPG